jgi:hypothetical protein
MTTSTRDPALVSAARRPSEEPAAESTWTSTSRLGFWVAILTAVGAAVALALGIATPMRSGVNCTGACIPYPYTDVASFVPRDYLWMYPAVLLMPLFVMLMACLQGYVREDRKVLSQVGLSFATLSAALIGVDYAISVPSRHSAR